MDTGTAKVDVSAKIEEIKRFMPGVYGAIQTKAAEIGNVAYELVRRGLRGEVNTFYAFEAGRVAGTPFNTGPIPAETAALMVQYGCAFVCIFNHPAPGAADGTH